MKNLILLVVFLLGYTIQAQNDNDQFDTWDGNSDGHITDQEFNTSWDENDYYNDWDSDNDGTISEEEWDQGVDTYYSDVNDWNKNRNRNFSNWDEDNDGVLNEDEFRNGSYQTWDVDGNNRIDRAEYTNYNTLGDQDRM